MASGTPLAEFNDFSNMTPPLYISSPEEMVNDAIVQAPLLGRMLLGQDPGKVIQGGERIQDTLLLNVTATGQHYAPGAPVGGYANRQSSSLWFTTWRYFRDYMVWTDKEIMQNAISGLTGDARVAVYKKIRFGKEQATWTSIFNGLDAALLANPSTAANYAAMEGTSAVQPMPLYAYINEETNGLPDGWTNVSGLPRATNPNWQPNLRRYDYAQPDDEDGDGDGLLDAFENTFLDLQFMPPRLPGTEKFFQKSGRDPNKMFIAASNGGVSFYKRRLLERNDTLASPSDPAYLEPKYAGVPVVQISGLGTALLYQVTSSAAQASELGTSPAVTTPGYRFYWIDANHLHPVIHAQKYFSREPVVRLQDQPDTFVQIVDVWWNLIATSCQRLGIVSPGA